MIKCMIYDMLHNTHNFNKINKILIDCVNIIENYNNKFYYSLILKDSINLLKYSIPSNIDEYMIIKKIVENIKYKLINNQNYKLYTLTECYKCESIINNYYCIKCEQMTCISCGVSYEFDIHNNCKNNNNNEYIQDDNIKKCPGCYVDIYKDEGCKIMWCVICKVHFNWNTLKIINKTHNPNFNNYTRNNIIKYNKICNNITLYKKIPSQLRNSIIKYLTKTINKTNELSIENCNEFINYIYINNNNINIPRFMFKIINEFIINLSKSTHIISDNTNIDLIMNDYINNKIDKIKFKNILINKNNIQEFDKKARNIALNCYHEYIILLNIIRVYNNNNSFNDILQLYYIYFANIYNLMKIYGIKKSKFMFNTTIDKYYESNKAIYILNILYKNTYNKLCVVKNNLI
ncbi:hypothetical protein MYSEV_256 [Mythimna separata entomopoxvirus 'L']|uniref:RING-type domain-containing protein n=1 Tax=Mythimna separata entomopoxvirus 'L' TaxID=1293572 RepID=A0A916NYS7_9POXV|nr:hypothetical protein MYSEV_256 [Mythimna separata entomopoxvirus 'L']CCU56454.1 hypothetical protein MYSEV_256 [Mythimna separata entomopoxvirus 'L']